MAFGGGIWLFQNKVLPGAYINFVSKARADATVSDRGYGALPMELDWGAEGSVIEVTTEDFQKDTLELFGYDYTHDKMKGLRDFFLNAKVGYFYRLNGNGAKASNTYATAKYSGIRGNDIAITISANVDTEGTFDVTTLVDGTVYEKQTEISAITDLADNDMVTFKKTGELSAAVGVKLTGGTNGATVTGTDHQNALDKLEEYNFNTLGCLSSEETVKQLYIQFCKRMRDEVGVKFQVITYKPTVAPDFEGAISSDDAVDTSSGDAEYSAVYWITGAEAGCAVNRSCTNKKYDGEFTIVTKTKQTELKKAINAGKLVFHKVGDEVRVLKDINTFTSFSTYKNRDFSLNQVIRVLDQWGNDLATLFNKSYLGKVQNNSAGRLAFWNDIVAYAEQLQGVEAIQEFTDKDVSVTQGKGKEDVYVECVINPVMAMEKLYMKTIVA